MNFEEMLEIDENTINRAEAKTHNALVFAFVGDAVFSLYVREYLASISMAKAGVLHSLAIKYVRASAQSECFKILQTELIDEELQICKSARNIKTNNVAKNASIDEYKKATEFETLIGYLYMVGDKSRLMDILKKSITIINNIKKEEK